MYDLIDRPVRDLPSFERHLLDAMRRWAHAFSVTNGGAMRGAEDAMSVVMRALDRGSSDDIVINRPCFTRVDESEAVLLGLWRMVRDGRPQLARAIAETLVDNRHAAALLNGMASILAGG